MRVPGQWSVLTLLRHIQRWKPKLWHEGIVELGEGNPGSEPGREHKCGKERRKESQNIMMLPVDIVSKVGAKHFLLVNPIGDSIEHRVRQTIWSFRLNRVILV